MTPEGNLATKPSLSSEMTKMSITLHGQEYSVACETGEEDKLDAIVAFANKKLDEIAARNANASDLRLLMLTCLMLTDELMEARKQARTARQMDEDLMVAAVNHLRSRVDHIAQLVDGSSR